MVNFTESEIKALEGQAAEARIMTYNMKKGYGFARTAEGREIFISSYQVLNRKEEKKLFLGTKIAFKYGVYQGRLCATEVQVLEKFPSGTSIVIETAENFWNFEIDTILKVGKSQLFQNKKFLDEVLKEENVPENYLEEGYSEEDFSCLFVETKDGIVYRFFDTDSKLKGNGHLNVSETYTSIYKQFFT